MKFKQVNWKTANRWLKQKQERLLEAYEKNNIEMLRHIQISILKDYRTTAIAVRRVTTNSGKKTPGLDGFIANTIEKREFLARKVYKIMRNPNAYKPMPVKRVWIPKTRTSAFRNTNAN